MQKEKKKYIGINAHQANKVMLSKQIKFYHMGKFY